MSSVICFVSDLFEDECIAFYADVARSLHRLGNTSCRLLTLTAKAARKAESENVFDHVSAVETQIGVWESDPRGNARRIGATFPDVHWSKIVASERAFTDYSSLLGGGGDRTTSADYVWSLVALLADSMTEAFGDVDLVVCQGPDTLISMVAIQVSKAIGVPCRIPVPAWVTPAAEEAGFLAVDEYLHSPEMLATFASLRQDRLNENQRAVAHALRDSILGSGGGKIYRVAPGRVSGLSPWSPHLRHPVRYIRKIRQQDVRIEYTRPDVVAKALTNVKRAWRKEVARRSLHTMSIEAIPSDSVFLPLHFQPEQSTLAQGVWFANQVAFVENISKSLPWGYTLIVKEHPVGRGSRPLAHYRHLRRLYNVEMCDAPSRDIMSKCRITVTVSGTAALESLMLRRPAVLAGGNFFDYFPGILHCPAPHELPDTLAEALRLEPAMQRGELDEEIDKALFAYAHSLVPAFPFEGSGSAYAQALLRVVNCT